MKTLTQQMFGTCNKLLSSKTPNRVKDVVEAHPSNIETAAQMESIHHLPISPPPTFSVDSVKEREHNGGGLLLSGIICVNILILGCALVSGSVFKSVAITAVHRQIFLIILLLLTILWMLFYMTFTVQKEEAVLFKDSHAGPVWLLGGLVLFGILSLIMDMFKIGYYIGYLHCDSAVKVAFPVVQAVFLFVQTYFLWVHAKDCVQLHKDFTRCGLILTLSTNLVVWMAAVAEESVHQTDIPGNASVKAKAIAMYNASYGDGKCKCSHSTCSTFKDAYYYLYPFNIEYSLFASAMAYVMWKNVGRLVDDHGHHKVKFHLKDVCLGPVAGILLLLTGLASFIVYEVMVTEKGEKRDHALLIYFIMNVVIVSLMSASTVVGCVVFKLDHRDHVSEKNPTRSLDVGLLVGASMGQFIICYFTIVAVVATGAKGYLNAFDLAGAVLTVVQLCLQNFFIVEGLHREPFHMMQAAALHTNAHASHDRTEMTSIDDIPSNFQLKKGLNWKRRMVKEVCAFLLLANVILWIMPAFGARPQFDHYIETKVYKFTMWAAVVNIGLPFGIFYRMHSVASLFEVYMTT